jgi:hypothetical protein
VVLTGTLIDASGSRPVRITWQNGNLFRLEELGGAQRVLLFDGTKLRNTQGTVGDDERRMIDSLIAALPETIFWQSASHSVALRFLGGRFRATEDTSADYAGPFSDVYSLMPGAPAAQAVFGSAGEDLVWIDSDALLIAQVTHTDNGRHIATQLTNWTAQGAQWYPASITRLEDGQQTLAFQVTGFQVNSASGITLFQN